MKYTLQMALFDYKQEMKDETILTKATSDGRYTEYRISDLYADKMAAKEALLVAWEQRLIELNERVDELRDELGAKGEK